MINSLEHVRTLEKAGLTRNQAETHVKVLNSVIGGGMVTKEEFKNGTGLLRKDLNNGLALLRRDLDNGLTLLRSDLDNGLALLRRDLDDGLTLLRKDLNNGLALLRKDLDNGLTLLRSDFKNDIKDLKIEFAEKFKTMVTKQELLDLKKELFAKIIEESQKSENRIIIKLGSLMVILFTVTPSILTFLS